MGFGKSTPIPGSAARKPKSGSDSGKDPSVAAFQQWLVDSNVLGYDKITGIYDQVTHEAVGALARETSSSGDVRQKNIGEILRRLYISDPNALRKNPAGISAVLLALQRAGFQEREQKKTIKDTPYYKITLPSGEERLLPLALVYSRGYTMYQAILEQHRLIDMNLPVGERLKQLDAMADSIRKSLPAEDPENSNILYVMTEADRDLRESWLKREAATTDRENAPTIVRMLGGLVPEFLSASATEQSQVINTIYTIYPSADKFMEQPPSINSKVIDIPEFRRNSASLAGTVRDTLDKLRGRR